MKTQIIKPSGYCQGVELAIKKALSLRKKYSENIYILGNLVHNKDTIKMLKSNGIETFYIEGLNYEELARKIPSDGIVILSAHGHSKKVENILKERNIEFEDATCPIVLSIMKIIENTLSKNEEVIYIGKENHPESLAALSLGQNVTLYDVKKGMLENNIHTTNPLVINQTTFSDDDIKPLQQEILSRFPKARIYPSICNAAKSRQQAIKNIDNSVDLVLIVGGKNSNNTNILWELAKKTYPNKTIVKIENKYDLNNIEKAQYNYCALLSGTSTPSEVIHDIDIILRDN